MSLDERFYLSRPALSDKERMKTLKHLAVAYPSGNTTALLFDRVLEIDRKTLNNQIMSSWKKRKPGSPEIEQCCFITKPKNTDAIARVEMFGGEFCGNAARSAIWVLTQGKDYEGLIEVSGAAKPLTFSVKEGSVEVEMPLPDQDDIVQIVEEGALVHLDGITHLVVSDYDNVSFSPRKRLESLLKADKYGCTSLPAFGVSGYEPLTQRADFCVWVKEVDTIFDETACGSGTCSIGIAMAFKNGKSTKETVIQPSEEPICTSATYQEGTIVRSTISGKVDVLYDNEYQL